MTKPGDKDWLPHAEHVRRLPKKRMASGVFMFNARDELLLLKPTYKESWIVPGGVIEQFESPLAAAKREVKEELGLDLDQLTFVAVIHTVMPEVEDEFLHFFFTAKTLSQVQIDSMHLQVEELEGQRFVSDAEVATLSRSSFVFHWPEIREAIRDRRPVLIENTSRPTA